MKCLELYCLLLRNSIFTNIIVLLLITHYLLRQAVILHCVLSFSEGRAEELVAGGIFLSSRISDGMILPAWHGLVLALLHLLIPCKMQESAQGRTNLGLFVLLKCCWVVVIGKLLISSKSRNLYLR